ncbi:hypothetical protein [Azotobacter chroococcum]|uniref:hypothetical protein n=1 Tax=Azotobacter chroococcum TaxID=353 RepID=UPI001B8B777E|nr:hypothetical protein [Azotobacter chroococcum]
MIDIDELKRLAEAATPGPWGRDGSYICPARIEDGTTYIESWRAIADAHDMENVRFIAAANPTAILALIADLQRLEKARATDAGMIMDMTRDIVSVGEALGIPGEEQEGGVGEFIEAIEQLKQTAPDFALRARVADLLHLLQFAKIETPSAGDAAQAVIAMNDLARMLAVAAPPAQQPATVTDELRGALLWMLWHHQGGGSKIGQPIRLMLGIGPFDSLTDEQITEAKAYRPTSPAQQSQAVGDVLEEHRARRQQWQDDYEEYGPDNAVVDCAALLLMEVAGIPVPPELDFNEWLSQEERSKGDREKLVSACTMILAEIEFMDRASAPGDTVPLALEPAEQQSAWVEQVMEQAQVFASAWSLVGGPFDTGNGLEQAEEEKERLRALLGSEA